MKKTIALVILGLFSQFAAFADMPPQSVSYVKTIECKFQDQCEGNSICQMKVYMSIYSFSEKSSEADGLVTWTQGPLSSKDGWNTNDEMTMHATIKSDGNRFEITTLSDYPPASVLTINNIVEGGEAEGKLTLSPSKTRLYKCRRFAVK